MILICFAPDIAQPHQMIQRLDIPGVFGRCRMRAAGKEKRFPHAVVFTDEPGAAQHRLLGFPKAGQTEQTDEMPLDPALVIIAAFDLCKGIGIIMALFQFCINFRHGQTALLQCAGDHIHRHGVVTHQSQQNIQLCIAAADGILTVPAQNGAQRRRGKLPHREGDQPLAVRDVHAGDKEHPAGQGAQAGEQIMLPRQRFVMHQSAPTAPGVVVHIVDDEQIVRPHLRVQFTEHILYDKGGSPGNGFAVLRFRSLYRADVRGQCICHQTFHTARKEGIKHLRKRITLFPIPAQQGDKLRFADAGKAVQHHRTVLAQRHFQLCNVCITPKHFAAVQLRQCKAHLPGRRCKFAAQLIHLLHHLLR